MWLNIARAAFGALMVWGLLRTTQHMGSLDHDLLAD
jgi:hypothetical protein